MKIENVSFDIFPNEKVEEESPTRLENAKCEK
jgi:hypothetical protein